jgi:hypothetical protein
MPIRLAAIKKNKPLIQRIHSQLQRRVHGATSGQMNQSGEIDSRNPHMGREFFREGAIRPYHGSVSEV